MIKLEFNNGFPEFPNITRTTNDPFLLKVQKSQKKWVVITDEIDNPKLGCLGVKAIFILNFECVI